MKIHIPWPPILPTYLWAVDAGVHPDISGLKMIAFNEGFSAAQAELPIYLRDPVFARENVR